MTRFKLYRKKFNNLGCRFCPQLLMDKKHPEVNPDHIIDAVLDGLREGEATYGVKVKNMIFWLRVA
jgi:hypothetical protein